MTVRVPNDVAAQAVAMGLARDPEDAVYEIRRMIDYSAPVTHENGNRRYKKWIFRVKDEVVLTISEIKQGR